MISKKSSFINEPYHIINLSFAGIIIMIFIYSGIFSAEKNNYPIKSACEVMTGQPCSSSGLSRSFSEIVRFNFASAKSYNPYGLKVFSFFLIQFFMRLIISLFILKSKSFKNHIVVFDILFSTALYFYCFWEIIF